MDDFYPTEPSLRGLSASGCGRQDKQLNTYDYLSDVPGNVATTDLVEVQFKNTRKGYYHNDNHLDLVKGDQVAVESNPGHDIGVVTLTGQLVLAQLKKAGLKANNEIRRVYRKARPSDLEKFEEAKAREHQTMIRSRQIAKELELDMKIGDVEFQGDGNKAIFYYIADARVDFRKLIRVLADEFHVRIEMRQIGARQEAGRIGGIGPCGRELCCATWMKSFNSVSTAAVRCQDIFPNPQKLAGQCAKLKCCMNYEVDTYIDAGKKLPPRDVTLETADATFYYYKADILTGMKSFNSVSTAAVRCQDIFPNPQKLAGQCAKLKCCMNYEVDTYIDAGKKLPPRDVTLETADATFYYYKADILTGMITYSTDKRLAANLVVIPAERALEVIRINKEGGKPERLDSEAVVVETRPADLLEQDSLTRFDKKRKKDHRRHNGNRSGNRQRRSGKDEARKKPEA